MPGIGGSSRGRAEHDRDLRHNPRHFDLVVKGAPTLVPSREETYLVGKACACRVDQVKYGNTHLHGQLLDAQTFLYSLFTCRTSLDCGVRGAKSYRASMDASHACDVTIRW